MRATQYAAEIGLLAVPMTLIIMSRGIDLSVASNMVLTAMVMGLLWRDGGLNIWAAAASALAVAVAGGALNGWMVARLGAPPLVVTLATMAIYRGAATGLSGGRGIVGFPDSFAFLGQGYVGPVPFQTLLWAVATVVGGLLLSYSTLGRQIRAIGYNETAALFSGVRVARIRGWLYVASGLAAGLAGLIYAARVGTAKSNAALGYELHVITAVVLGGTTLAGGDGTIAGTTLGVLLLTVLRNGFNLARIPASVQDVLVGMVLVVAVLSYQLRAGRRGRGVVSGRGERRASGETGQEARS